MDLQIAWLKGIAPGRKLANLGAEKTWRSAQLDELRKGSVIRYQLVLWRVAGTGSIWKQGFDRALEAEHATIAC